jgi:hypothetical protein
MRATLSFYWESIETLNWPIELFIGALAEHEILNSSQHFHAGRLLAEVRASTEHRLILPYKRQYFCAADQQ